jgi:CubicO group peptidase (beta-lactamase class C family)
MKILKRTALAFLPVVILLAMLGGGALTWLVWQSREVGAGYCAKVLATGVFVLGRTPESVRSEELRYAPLWGYSIDHEARTATAWIFPSVRRTAVYREGLGVALALDEETVGAIRAQARPGLRAALEPLDEAPWPMGNAPSGRPRPTGFDEGKLAEAVDHMFSEPRRFPTRNTRAVVIAYQGEIIAEQYAPAFDAESRHAGWSTAKSVFHALVGVAVRDGKIEMNDPAPVPAWQGEGDPRAEITLDDLLRMRSGIDYSDFDFERRPLVGELIFGHSGAAEYFMARPLAHPPGTQFAYASGSTNLLSWVLRQTFGDDAYYELPYKELFDKLGMRSAGIEADATGTLIGSSFFYGTARDFVRFGLLYQNDGVWQGERILPEGWVAQGRTPARGGPEHYGAHWWLSTAGDRERARARGLELPEDTFHASGYEGQQLLVIPSMELVLIRLGLCYFSDFPLYEEFFNVLDAFPDAHLAGR